VDFDLGLVVGSGREDLRFLSGDGGVAFDHRGSDPAKSLDAQGQGGDVEK
jgi:hypothetical protein